MALTTVVVTGTLLDAGGNPLNGEISFTPTTGETDPYGNPIVRSIIDTTDKQVIPMTGITARLDHGAFSTQLVATDNAGLEPAGWQYQVLIQIPGIPDYGFTCFIPSSPNPVDLSALGA